MVENVDVKMLRDFIKKRDYLEVFCACTVCENCNYVEECGIWVDIDNVLFLR